MESCIVIDMQFNEKWKKSLKQFENRISKIFNFFFEAFRYIFRFLNFSRTFPTLISLLSLYFCNIRSYTITNFPKQTKFRNQISHSFTNTLISFSRKNYIDSISPLGKSSILSSESSFFIFSLEEYNIKTFLYCKGFSMGNDIHKANSDTRTTFHQGNAQEKNVFGFFSLETDSGMQEESVECRPVEIREPQCISIGTGCASKLLFNYQPEDAISKSSHKRISYRKYHNKNKDLEQYESKDDKLTPITFSTLCSIQEQQLQNTYQNSQSSSNHNENAGEQSLMFSFAHDDDLVLDYLAKFVEGGTQNKIEQEQFIRIKKYDISKDYTFLEKLGEGAFGEVYKCENRRTGEARAVKILKRNIFTNPRVKEQFLQEFNILKKTSHPNIIRIYEIYQFSNYMYIISELCSGGSLGDFLRHVPKPSQQLVMEILLQVFRGVNYLHNLHIIHRDIKPENIVFVNEIHQHSTPQEVDVRIIDFGLAFQCNEKIFKDWAKIGTISYMAPQVFDGFYTTKCDSWACGVIMYQLITGQNPFKSLSQMETRHKIHSFVPDPYSKILFIIDQRWAPLSNEVKYLVLKLLDLNYINRLSISEAIKHNFFSKVEECPLNKEETSLRFINYYHGSNLISALESYLSFTYVSQQQRRIYSQVFNQIDTGQNGFITLEELQTFLSPLQPEFSQEEILHIFTKINKSQNGQINFGEFINIFLDRKELFNSLYLQQTFNFIDLNHNNTIEKDELKFFLKSLSKEEIDSLFKNFFNITGNGRIQLQGFIKYIQQQVY